VGESGPPKVEFPRVLKVVAIGWWYLDFQGPAPCHKPNWQRRTGRLNEFRPYVDMGIHSSLRQCNARRVAFKNSEHWRDFFEFYSWANFSNASRTISIPRPGPSGTLTMPLTCSIGFEMIA
jgi:hypothetical protein